MDPDKYDAVYDFVVKLKQMGKSKEEAIKELRKIRVDEEYIAPIISKVYSQEAEDSKEEQQEVKKEQTPHKQKTLSFLNTLFFFLLFISSLFIASMYAIDRLFGLSYFPYALLFTSVLFIMFLSFIFLSFKSYIKSTFFYIVSLLLTVSTLGVISYFEFKPLVPGILYLFYSHYLYRQYLENLALYLLLGGGLFILYSLVLTFISKRISFKGISYKSMKKGSYIVLSLALLVIIATFLYVNVLFKEEVRVKPLSVGVAQCEGIHLSENVTPDRYSIFGFMRQVICSTSNEILNPSVWNKNGFVFVSKKEITQFEKAIDITKKVLAKDRVNIKNRRERDIYSFYLIDYSYLILPYSKWVGLLEGLTSTYTRTYFYPPTKKGILDKSIIEVCNYTVSSLPKEYYKKKRENLLFPIEYLVTSKYNLINLIKFLDCFENSEDKIYVVYLNKSNCTQYYPCPLTASPIYELRQKGNLSGEIYHLVPRKGDIQAFEELLRDYIDIYDQIIYNYRTLFDNRQIYKLEEALRKNTHVANEHSRYISLDNFTKISDNEVEFVISYPSKYDDVLYLDKESDIQINGEQAYWNKDTEYSPSIKCNKYKDNTRVRYVCKVTNVKIKNNSYNSLYLQILHLPPHPPIPPRIIKYMYAYVGS